MSEHMALEPTEPISLSRNKLIAYAAGTIVGGFIIGAAIGHNYADDRAKEAEARAWLANRGIPACEDAPQDAVCVLAAIPSELEVVISRPEGEPATVNCLFDPRYLEPGCYIDTPDGFNEPYDHIITGPESILSLPVLD